MQLNKGPQIIVRIYRSLKYIQRTRIYELVANIIQRSIYIKDHAVKEYVDKLEQKEAIISEYQNKAAAAVEDAKVSMQLAETLEKEKEDLSNRWRKCGRLT
jgi:hypothetical protein